MLRPRGRPPRTKDAAEKQISPRRLRAAQRTPEFLLPGEPPSGPPPLQFEVEEFRARLARWFREHARDLPWRRKRDGYSIWLSEIMLQQTRVATVLDRYREFLVRFPTLHALAMADEHEVLALWSGLGYYRRARLLHHAAQFVVRELRGKLPRTAEGLRTLPGVGEYTAAAIASIAFCEPVAVVDGNVERVLLRVMGMAEDGTTATRKLISRVADALVRPAPMGRTRANAPGSHNQAMMELGATICLPRQPLCLQCPVVEFCRTRGEHPTLARAPQKSRVVAHLLAVRKSGTTTEVLLERRPEEASLMPGMLELPPLPLDNVEGREPVLRLRHSITNTNFYVQVFAQAVANVAQREELVEEEHRNSKKTIAASARDEGNEDEQLFVADNVEHEAPLLDAVPLAEADLRWFPTSQLQELPLTGLARKVLQRLGVMALPKVRLR